MSEKRNKMNECWSCAHRRAVPGNAHIKCVNPDIDMRGEPHGINHGWFLYPLCFDPVWKLKDCANYKEELPAGAREIIKVTKITEI